MIFLQVISFLKFTKLSSTVFPTGGIFISYTQNAQLITITNITGLPANNSFLLTVVAWLQ